MAFPEIQNSNSTTEAQKQSDHADTLIEDPLDAPAEISQRLAKTHTKVEKVLSLYKKFTTNDANQGLFDLLSQALALDFEEHFHAKYRDPALLDVEVFYDTQENLQVRLHPLWAYFWKQNSEKTVQLLNFFYGNHFQYINTSGTAGIEIIQESDGTPLVSNVSLLALAA